MNLPIIFFLFATLSHTIQHEWINKQERKKKERKKEQWQIIIQNCANKYTQPYIKTGSPLHAYYSDALSPYPCLSIINLHNTNSMFPFWWCIINIKIFKYAYQFTQKGLRRESNPGLPHPKREFYHLTTKPRHVHSIIHSINMSKRALPGIEPGPPVP